MEILFEDEYIVVCIKPLGVISQSDANGGDSMIKRLSEHTNGIIYPLHRLDRDVGGVMVFAKTQESASILSSDIANHKFKKEYLALVHGKPQQKGEMRDLLFKDSRKNKSYVVNRKRKGVKEALLEYELLESKDDLSLVKVLLHTGRTHQIRVQFASRGMPLVGDRKYGSKDDFKNIGLWSYRITLKHPETKELIMFEKFSDNFKSQP